jgi:rod shape-determining protein MreC
MPSFLKRRRNLIILASMILFQLILISIQVPLTEEENVFERVLFFLFSPVQHVVVSAAQKVSDIWNGYFHLRDARKENIRLTQEASQLRQENLLLKQLLKRRENAEDIQEIYKNVFTLVIQARAVSWDAANPYKSMNINKGSQDGVTKNLVVLDEFGNLVGRISGPVHLKEARVLLITDSLSGVSVSTADKNSVGILTGGGKNSCRLKYILATDEALKVGDMVYTTGYDGIFPPGIPAGKVISHQGTPGLFQEVLVRPNFDLRKMDRLAVVAADPKDVF